MDGACVKKLENRNYKKCCMCGKNDYNLTKIDESVHNHIQTNFNVHVDLSDKKICVQCCFLLNLLSISKSLENGADSTRSKMVQSTCCFDLLTNIFGVTEGSYILDLRRKYKRYVNCLVDNGKTVSKSNKANKEISPETLQNANSKINEKHVQNSLKNKNDKEISKKSYKVDKLERGQSTNQQLKKDSPTPLADSSSPKKSNISKISKLSTTTEKSKLRLYKEEKFNAQIDLSESKTICGKNSKSKAANSRCMPSFDETLNKLDLEESGNKCKAKGRRKRQYSDKIPFVNNENDEALVSSSKNSNFRTLNAVKIIDLNIPVEKNDSDQIPKSDGVQFITGEKPTNDSSVKPAFHSSVPPQTISTKYLFTQQIESNSNCKKLISSEKQTLSFEQAVTQCDLEYSSKSRVNYKGIRIPDAAKNDRKLFSSFVLLTKPYQAASNEKENKFVTPQRKKTEKTDNFNATNSSICNRKSILQNSEKRIKLLVSGNQKKTVSFLKDNHDRQIDNTSNYEIKKPQKSVNKSRKKMTMTVCEDTEQLYKKENIKELDDSFLENIQKADEHKNQMLKYQINRANLSSPPIKKDISNKKSLKTTIFFRKTKNNTKKLHPKFDKTFYRFKINKLKNTKTQLKKLYGAKILSAHVVLNKDDRISRLLRENRMTLNLNTDCDIEKYSINNNSNCSINVENQKDFEICNYNNDVPNSCNILSEEIIYAEAITSANAPFESPSTTLDSVTSGYSSTTVESVTNYLIIDAINPIINNLNSLDINVRRSNEQILANELNGDIFLEENIAFNTEVEIETEALEEIKADDIINVLGKASENDIDLCINEDDTNENNNCNSSPSCRMLDLNISEVSNSSFLFLDEKDKSYYKRNKLCTSLPNTGIRTKASLKQIDQPLDNIDFLNINLSNNVRFNGNYNNDASAMQINHISSQLIRNENPMFPPEKNLINICDSSETVVSSADCFSIVENQTLSSPTRNSKDINVTFSTPSKQNNHFGEEEELLIDDLLMTEAQNSVNKNYVETGANEEIEKLRLELIGEID